jgi:hypothetical protein
MDGQQMPGGYGGQSASYGLDAATDLIAGDAFEP